MLASMSSWDWTLAAVCIVAVGACLLSWVGVARTLLSAWRKRRQRRPAAPPGSAAKVTPSPVRPTLCFAAPGCPCPLCVLVRRRPDVLVTAADVASLQAAVASVASGRTRVSMRQREGLSPEGVSQMVILVMDGDVYDRDIEPVLHKRFGPGRDCVV